jgi:hypothetical protein
MEIQQPPSSRLWIDGEEVLTEEGAKVFGVAAPLVGPSWQ